LVSARGPLPQHSVRLLRDILDLHTRHSATLAPLAPQCKSGRHWRHNASRGATGANRQVVVAALGGYRQWRVTSAPPRWEPH
jgi:hypothetical protein